MSMWQDKRVRIGADVSKWTVEQVVDGRPFRDDFPDMDVRVVPITDELFVNLRLNHANGTKETGDYRLTVSYRGTLPAGKGFCFAEKSHPYLFKRGKTGVGKQVDAAAFDMAKGLLAEAVRRQKAGTWLRVGGAATIEREDAVPKAEGLTMPSAPPKAAPGIVSADMAKVVTDEVGGL